MLISQLQVKSLGLGSAGAFLQRAPEAPEPRAVEHALDTLRTMGALNEAEDLTSLGEDLHIGIGYAGLLAAPRIQKAGHAQGSLTICRHRIRVQCRTCRHYVL